MAARSGADSRSVRAGRAVRAGALGVLLLSAAACAGPTPVASPPVAATSTSAVAPLAPLLLTASAPVRVTIPAIGVDSQLLDLGLQADGTLAVPPDGTEAGWFTGAPTPGELGPAVIVGHVDWGGAPGVFFRLRELRAGDLITVTRQDGSTPVFAVQRVELFAKDAFPTAAVYGDLDHAGLRVITCGGSFDHRARSYVDNTVVFADLVSRGTA
jgi:sortase family protein